MCFKLFKPSPNDLKFIVTFEIIHMKGHMCWSLYVHIYWIMYWMLIILILNAPNDYNRGNVVIMLKSELVVHLIIM
jgi:hypothetical protein